MNVVSIIALTLLGCPRPVPIPEFPIPSNTEAELVGMLIDGSGAHLFVSGVPPNTRIVQGRWACSSLEPEQTGVVVGGTEVLSSPWEGVVSGTNAVLLQIPKYAGLAGDWKCHPSLLLAPTRQVFNTSPIKTDPGFPELYIPGSGGSQVSTDTPRPEPHPRTP